MVAGDHSTLDGVLSQVAAKRTKVQRTACFEDLSDHFSRILKIAARSNTAAGLMIQKEELLFPEDCEPLLTFCGFEPFSTYWYFPKRGDPKRIHNALEAMLVGGTGSSINTAPTANSPAHLKELMQLRKQEYVQNKPVVSSGDWMTDVAMLPWKLFVGWCRSIVGFVKWLRHPLLYVVSWVLWIGKGILFAAREVFCCVTTFPFWVAIAVCMVCLVACCSEKVHKNGLEPNRIVCYPPWWFADFFGWCTRWRTTVFLLKENIILVVYDVIFEFNARANDLQLMALNHWILGPILFAISDFLQSTTEFLQLVGIIGTCPLGSAERHVARCRTQEAWKMVEYARSCSDVKKAFRRAALTFHGDHISAPGCDRTVIEACSVARNILHDQLVEQFC